MSRRPSRRPAATAITFDQKAVSVLDGIGCATQPDIPQPSLPPIRPTAPQLTDRWAWKRAPEFSDGLGTRIVPYFSPP